MLDKKLVFFGMLPLKVSQNKIICCLHRDLKTIQKHKLLALVLNYFAKLNKMYLYLIMCIICLFIVMIKEKSNSGLIYIRTWEHQIDKKNYDKCNTKSLCYGILETNKIRINTQKVWKNSEWHETNVFEPLSCFSMQRKGKMKTQSSKQNNERDCSICENGKTEQRTKNKDSRLK